MGELRYDGQVAIVTGGAAGIGKGYSKLLAARGARVVINGNYRPSGAGPEEDLAAELRAAGFEAVGVNGSIGDEASAQKIVQKAIDTWGRLDILVNNAGNSDTTMLVQDAPDERLDAQLDIHVKGTMRVTRAAWPHLKAAGAGRILNTGSATAFGALGPLGYEAAYGVAKSALFALTRQMAGAGEADGIKANLVLPWAYSAMAEHDLKGTPLKDYMEANFTSDQIAAACAYLLHAECPVTAQFFSAAGGRLARVIFASPAGYHNPALTPEDIRDNWAAVMGEIPEMFEIPNLAGEFKVLRKMMAAKAAQ